MFALVFAMALASCGSNTPDSAADSNGTDTTATETTTTEETSENEASTRKSPPRTAEGEIGSATVTVNYGSPSVRGRSIFGDLVPFGNIWRTGANEATTITFSEDVAVEGEAIPAGTYALFTIPGEEAWTIIFNKEAEQWGAYDYDEAMDALRVEVKPETMEENAEMLQFKVGSESVSLMWADQSVTFGVSTVE